MWFKSEKLSQHPLIEQLLSNRKEIYGEAIKSLEKLDFEAKVALVPPLRDALKHRNKGIRKAAQWALGYLKESAKESIPELILTLKDKDWEIRSGAGWALGEIGLEAKVVIPHIIGALKDKHPYVRNNAAMTLGKFGTEAQEAVSALIESLQDKDVYVRYWAALALGNIGSEIAIPALEKTTQDRDNGVSRNAEMSLKKIKK